MKGGRALAILASLATLALTAPAQAQSEPAGDGSSDDERQAVVDAHEAALQARRDSLHALNPSLPAVAETHTGAALEGWTHWVEISRNDPSDAFVFEPPIDHEVLAVGVEEIDGAQVAFVSDCQLEQGERRIGASFEPAPSDDPADRNTSLGADVMTKVGGTWKLGLFMQVLPGELGTLGCMAD